MEYDKRIHKNHVFIKRRDEKRTYTKLPANLYGNMANAIDNKKDLKLYYSFYVSLIKTNTNNSLEIERDATQMKMYLPNSFKQYRKNRIEMMKTLNDSLRYFDKLEQIYNKMYNNSKISLPYKLSVNIVDKNNYTIKYENSKRVL